MSTPIIDQARPAGLAGVMCAGYGRKHHIVTTNVYHVRHCSVHLCWDCLLALGRDQIMPKRAITRRRRLIR